MRLPKRLLLRTRIAGQLTLISTTQCRQIASVCCLFILVCVCVVGVVVGVCPCSPRVVCLVCALLLRLSSQAYTVVESSQVTTDGLAGDDAHVWTCVRTARSRVMASPKRQAGPPTDERRRDTRTSRSQSPHSLWRRVNDAHCRVVSCRACAACVMTGVVVAMMRVASYAHGVIDGSASHRGSLTRRPSCMLLQQIHTTILTRPPSSCR
jgi:hypothetical protein